MRERNESAKHSDFKRSGLGWTDIKGRILIGGLLLHAFIPVFLHAADAERHSTTNGVHRGVITHEASTSTALDPLTIPGGRNFIGQFTLGYAVWTLIQEPVQDFTFIWEWQRGDCTFTNCAGPALSTRDLAKYPDLLKQFYVIKPNVTIQADVEFYDASGQRIGLGHKTIVPDLVNPAGPNDPLHVPGSPTWAKFFQLDGTSDAAGSRQKALFKSAASIRLVRPEITQVIWSQTFLDLLAEKYYRLEQAATNSDRPQVAGVKSNTVAKPKVTSGQNPFEAARKTTAAPNPFEQASGQARSAANPLELAAQGMRTTAENPMEKTVRLEAEERARQAELARQAEIARKAEIARQEGLRREEARQAEVARQEREAERQAELAQQSYLPAPVYYSPPNSYDPNEEFQRASRELDERRAASDASRAQNNGNFAVNMNRMVNEIVNAGTPAASRSSGGFNQSTFVAPNRDRDQNLSLQAHKVPKYKKVYDIQCPTCSGTGRCQTCRNGGHGTHREPIGSLPSLKGIKGAVIEAGSDNRPTHDVPNVCSSGGKCTDCNGKGLLEGRYRNVEEP